MIDTVQASTLAAVASMEQAVGRVGQGVEMASRASDAMQSIREGARQVVSVVGEISGALMEQSTASNDISSNVERIARMAEENGAATREAADTAQRLEKLAGQTREDWSDVGDRYLEGAGRDPAVVIADRHLCCVHPIVSVSVPRLDRT